MDTKKQKVVTLIIPFVITQVYVLIPNTFIFVKNDIKTLSIILLFNEQVILSLQRLVPFLPR